MRCEWGRGRMRTGVRCSVCKGLHIGVLGRLGIRLESTRCLGWPGVCFGGLWCDGKVQTGWMSGENVLDVVGGMFGSEKFAF